MHRYFNNRLNANVWYSLHVVNDKCLLVNSYRFLNRRK